MKTQIIKISDLSRDAAKLRQAARIIEDGGLVALPTETVYGIAANALDPDAVAGIFRVKGRPQDNPLIVHAAELEDVFPLVQDFPDDAMWLAKKFWPGPLTIVLLKNDIVPDIVSAGLDTVAVRMPSHPVTRAIIRESGLPLAAPSANISGRPSPTTAAHCIEDLNGKVDMIIDGGECSVGLESTVVSLAVSPPRLLRPGAVTLEDLRFILGDVAADAAVTSKLPNGSTAASPGMKYRHYSPKAKITLVHGNFADFARYIAKKPAATALVFDGEDKRLKVPCVTYGGANKPEEQAQQLFAALRRLDEIGAERVYARAPEITGLGLAVYNRLIRAAAFDEMFI